MTLASIYSVGRKIHCELTMGGLSANGEASTFFGALVKTYCRLLFRKLRILKRS